LDKKFYNSLKTGPNFLLQHFKNKILFNFVKFVATKKGMTKKFFHPSSLLRFLDPGSGMGKKSGCGIRDKHPGSTTLVWMNVKIINVKIVAICHFQQTSTCIYRQIEGSYRDWRETEDRRERLGDRGEKGPEGEKEEKKTTKEK
jgi:hypothetical protein